MKQIKSLTVLKNSKIFYQIDFETNQEIGINNVSKKILVALVDFCLGGNWNQNLTKHLNLKEIVDDLKMVLVKLVLSDTKLKKSDHVVIERSVADNQCLKINRQDFSQTRDALKTFCNVLEQKLIDPHPLKTLKTNLKWQIEQSEDLQKQLWSYQSQLRIINDKISECELKKSLFEETIDDLVNNRCDEDVEMLKMIYEQATNFDFTKINKNFQDLINYHNFMTLEKSDWINQNRDLEMLDQEIVKLEAKREKLLKQLNLLKKQLLSRT